MHFGRQFLGLAVAGLMVLGAVAPTLAGSTVTVTATVPATISVTVMNGAEVSLGTLSSGNCTPSANTTEIKVISNAAWYGTVSVTNRTGPALGLYRKSFLSASSPGADTCSQGTLLTESGPNAWIGHSGGLQSATPLGTSFFEGYGAIGGVLAGTTVWTLTYSASQS